MCMRRRPIRERFKQEAELALRLLGAQPDRVEHALLHFGAVDTDRAAAEFVAVEHDVVCLAQRLARDLMEVVDVFIAWSRERMVDRGPRILTVRPIVRKDRWG